MYVSENVEESEMKERESKVFSFKHLFGISLWEMWQILEAPKGREKRERSLGSTSKNSHPMCTACLVVRHGQAVLANPECCLHCSHFPLRV